MIEHLIKTYKRRTKWSAAKITEQHREESAEIADCLEELLALRKRERIELKGTVS